jgi:putative ABC transport system permease protein
VQVWRSEPPSLQFGAASYRRYVEWRSRNRVFEELGAWAPAARALTGGDAPERITTGRASASFFRVIGSPPLLGRWFSDDEDRVGGEKVVVVSEAFWRRRLGGSTAALGTTLTLDAVPHTVIGVAPAPFGDTWRMDTWVPLALNDDIAPSGNFLMVFGRMRDGIGLEQARAGLADLAAEMTRAFPEDRYGFTALSLHDVLTRGPRQALWILLGTTGLVLLIACANVANLLLARAVSRQREMAVRTALGAGRGRLARQLVTETVLLAVSGGLAGLVLAAGLLRIFTLLAPANFPRLAAITIDWTVLAFSLGVALLCGFLAGVLPGVHVARAVPGEALREGSTRGATGGRARGATRLLVMSEVALAVMLVATAALTVKSLQQLTRQDLGLDTENVVTFSITMPTSSPVPGGAESERIAQFFQTFEERLRGLPGVRSVGAINLLPIAQTGTNGQVFLRDRTLKPEEAPLAEFRVVTPSYFESVRIPLLAGRLLDERDTRESVGVVVINETLARILWPDQPPAAAVGQFMTTGFDNRTHFREVVGVVHDVRSRRVDAPPDAETYVPLAQYPWPTMTFTLRTTMAPESVIPQVRSALADLDPRLPLASVRTFREVIEGATRASRMYSALTALFGILAATLAAVGIYSVMSYSVAQRTRELAIRSALGASSQGLLGLVLREGFLISGLGILGGIAGAAAASGLVQALLYQVSPRDPLILAATALGVAAVALLGYLIPALRAARVQPAVALRSE